MFAMKNMDIGTTNTNTPDFQQYLVGSQFPGNFHFPEFNVPR
jgi:hypothetical protein